ncbi:MAG: flippase-like domain-containing protein, partial [Bacteroidales bacterium]|nr:flippase-like domain-containing protein [Bacteroidales bacterium]
MKKNIFQALKFVAFLIAGAGLMWLAFGSVDFRKLYDELKIANYSWLLLSIFFGLAAYLSRARRWSLLIKPLGYKHSFINSFNALMTGYLANLALPRIGEITRCVALGRKEKIPVDQLIGTVIVERSIDFISLVAIMIGFVFTSSMEVKRFIKESIIEPVEQSIISVFGSAWILWASLLILGTAAMILMIIYRRSLKKIRFFAKLFDILKGIVNGLNTIRTLKHKGEFIFHTVFIWVSYLMMTWVVVFSLEATSHITIGDSIFLLVIGG